jgi:subtilisin family serine protease
MDHALISLHQVSIPPNVWQGYYHQSGTSMACPHVAGVAALLLQEDPSLTPAQLTAIMLFRLNKRDSWTDKGFESQIGCSHTGKNSMSASATSAPTSGPSIDPQ